MEGIHFVEDGDGKKKAVLIDLEKYGELLEDFFAVVISEHRLTTETAIPFEGVVAEIAAERVEQAERSNVSTPVYRRD
ncbi:MAG: hypothetical protein O3A46_02405 [Candidatus Poribacteria bacterium]|nr:hypothetical protein [Candidatus Poribacteria bacterium]